MNINVEQNVAKPQAFQVLVPTAIVWKVAATTDQLPTISMFLNCS